MLWVFLREGGDGDAGVHNISEAVLHLLQTNPVFTI